MTSEGEDELLVGQELLEQVGAVYQYRTISLDTATVSKAY